MNSRCIIDRIVFYHRSNRSVCDFVLIRDGFGVDWCLVMKRGLNTFGTESISLKEVHLLNVMKMLFFFLSGFRHDDDYDRFRLRVSLLDIIGFYF